MTGIEVGGVRVLLLLNAAQGQQPPSTTRLGPVVDEALSLMGDAVVGISVGQRVRTGIPGQEEYDAIAEQGLSNGVRLGGIDTVVDLCLRDLPDDSATAKLFSDACTELGSAIDPGRSTVAIGKVATIIEGSGPLRLVYCMRRLPGVTHQEFSDFWINQHATVAKLTAHICAYLQLHVDLERSRSAVEGARTSLGEVDGIALDSFENMDRFLQCVRPDPSFAQRARRSEENVNDLARVTAVLTAVEQVYGR